MWRSQDFDRFERETWQPRPVSRPLFESHRTAVRQFIAGALSAFAIVGVGYAAAQVTTPHPHRTTTTTTTTR